MGILSKTTIMSFLNVSCLTGNPYASKESVGLVCWFLFLFVWVFLTVICFRVQRCCKMEMLNK